MTEKIDKSLVGKYVCYAKSDGSFTWGRIKDQGFQNCSKVGDKDFQNKGEREVFIMTDQIVCRVANNELELASIWGLERRLEAGKGGTTMLPGPTDPRLLPDYQRFGDTKLLPEKVVEAEKEENKLLPVPVKEKQGLIPRLGKQLGFCKSKGLPMMQKVGMVVSTTDGRNIKFVLRRFGYDTTIVKGSLNLKKDIIDADDPVYNGMTDGEVFLMAMRAKLQGSDTQVMFGTKKPLELNEGKE